MAHSKAALLQKSTTDLNPDITPVTPHLTTQEVPQNPQNAKRPYDQQDNENRPKRPKKDISTEHSLLIIEVNKLKSKILKLQEKIENIAKENKKLKTQNIRLKMSKKKINIRRKPRRGPRTMTFSSFFKKNKLPKVLKALLIRAAHKSRKFDDTLRKFAMKLEYISPAGYR